MEFVNKIVVIIRDDLLVWQKLNVTAFLMSGIGGIRGDQCIIGEPYIDGDGVTYLAMAQQPIMVYSASGQQLKDMLKKALTRDVKMTIYTEELFRTGNDAENRAKVAEYKTDCLNVVGLGILGKKTHVDRMTKGLKLHD